MLESRPTPANRRDTEKPVLVIDAEVAEAGLLIDDLDDAVDILLLIPGRSGLGQIADYLEFRRDVPSLHILSHGQPGALFLAGSRIDLASLVLSQKTLDTIAAALSADASVVLYGCSVMAGPKGSSFTRFLGVALDADVSASLMPVGSLALGGDWILRNIDGEWIEPIFTSNARVSYPALLADGRRMGRAFA
ncbi:DUF4347 domain-containing protein [Thalassobaculum sp. OXR-137]|uniref:DUF4347 domain-containing protein n=1 Tax=Thalassobaculum sp. OXR-137 TaxID=3100173 RepID=UPI002AC9524E|nr:DUF4347 domain-containing protein [Thalassobaculum sp. OXR-137]WPZ32629.1 DUF4347 domain-containing protein [Thalassobaculum sp. OXR-137]